MPASTIMSIVRKTAAKTGGRFAQLGSGILSPRLTQRVLNEHDGNIFAAAKALYMHHRAFQRKLRKHSR